MPTVGHGFLSVRSGDGPMGKSTDESAEQLEEILAVRSTDVTVASS